MIKFGSAGNPRNFYDHGFNKSEFMPQYLNTFSLDAYEYQCSRGVRVSDEKAKLLKEESEKYGISLSVHAPYYISLSTNEDIKKENSINYILHTAKVAQKMGADRIVIHSGAVLGMDRISALHNAMHLLCKALNKLDELGLGNIHLCPETMGKFNQLGTSEEVIALCQIDKRLIPTIDFGHLYCRTLGKLNTFEAWESELKLYISALGYERMKHFHSHFSKMIYTESGGEKCHVTFSKKDCGPDFETLARVLLKLDLEPRIICESAGTQTIDAKQMMDTYYTLKKFI